MSSSGGIGNPSSLSDYVLNRAYEPAGHIPDRPEGEWIPVHVRIDWRLSEPTVEKGLAVAWRHDCVRVRVLDLSEPMTIWLDPSNVKRRHDG